MVLARGPGGAHLCPERPQLRVAPAQPGARRLLLVNRYSGSKAARPPLREGRRPERGEEEGKDVAGPPAESTLSEQLVGRQEVVT